LRRAGIVQGKRAGAIPMTETVIASRIIGGRRFEIDTDPTRLDIALIHHFLAKCSHWARDILLDTLRRAVAHSLVFGIYREGTQVGFARIVTDQATFAYLADVFVVAEERNAGLGQWLIETILAHPPLQGLRRWLLVTKNAKSLYLRCGFAELSPDVSYLERFDPTVRVYRGGSYGSDHHDPASDGGRRRRARRTPEHAGAAWAHQAVDRH
jgi:N-acetylglutamate synthase-like GNAT family acetyltransferase